MQISTNINTNTDTNWDLQKSAYKLYMGAINNKMSNSNMKQIFNET